MKKLIKIELVMCGTLLHWWHLQAPVLDPRQDLVLFQIPG